MTSRITPTTRVLVVLFIILSTLTVWQIWEGSQTRSDVDLVRDQLAELCSSGSIDCAGTRGLPGTDGTPGTGIRDISCWQGQFRFELTNGRVVNIGDCVAQDGRDGRDGKDGARGPRGFTGPTGKTGARGPRGFPGKQGPRGPRGPKGSPGNSGHGHNHRLDQLENMVENLLDQLGVP